MRKVKCGIENAEWRWLIEATNHVTAVIPQITTPISQPAMRKMLSSYQRRQNSFFWPWMQSTVFSKCLLYAVQLIWVANKWTDVYAWQHVCWWKPSRKHKKLYIVTFRPQLQLVCLTAVFLIVIWCHSNEAQGSYFADVVFTGQWITVLYYCENNVCVCVFGSYDNLYYLKWRQYLKKNNKTKRTQI